MSFLGNPPLPAPEDEAPKLQNDGWFPDIDLAELRATARLDGSVTPERLRHATLAAVIAVNDELAAFKGAQLAAGDEALDRVPAPRIGGQSRLLQLYRRAVYSQVQADLIERYRNFDTTGAGDKRAEALDASVCELRRDARWALSDLLGIRRSTVELI